MKTHDAPKRSPGEPEDLAIHGRPAPYQDRRAAQGLRSAPQPAEEGQPGTASHGLWGWTRSSHSNWRTEMKTHNAPKRSPGDPGELAIHGRPVPYQTGVLPKDFVQPQPAEEGQRPHLERLRTGSGGGQEADAQVAAGDRALRRGLPLPREPRPHDSGRRGHPHGRRLPDVSLAELTPCPASARTTGAEATTSSPTTSATAWCGSRRNPACPGLRSPGGSERHPSPSGGGGSAGSAPAPTTSWPSRTWPTAWASATCCRR